MHLQNVGYAQSETNVSTTGSYLVTTICSEQLTNTSLITIAGGLIEISARERHAGILERYRENPPGISYQNRSSAGCIMNMFAAPLEYAARMNKQEGQLIRHRHALQMPHRIHVFLKNTNNANATGSLHVVYPVRLVQIAT